MQEALESIAQHHPHALLCEIMLAEEDGYSLIDKIRHLEVEYKRQIPTTAVTTQGMLSDQIRAMWAGFQHYFVKPIDLNELTPVVAQLTRRAIFSSVTINLPDLDPPPHRYCPNQAIKTR